MRSQLGLLMLLQRHCLKNLLIACFTLPIAGSLIAADWPQWRGPNPDGHWPETRIISSFPSGGLVPKWNASVGFGYSAPIISKGKLSVSGLSVEGTNVHERVL